MNLPTVAVVLQAALSHNHDEREAAEENLNQFQYAPQHLVRLLEIIVDGNCDLAVRQVASIHFKNFVAKNWTPAEPAEPQKISGDKGMVRDNILGFITQVPPLLSYQSRSLETRASIVKESCDVQSYEMSPYKDSDNEDGDDEIRRRRKYIPQWARVQLGECLETIVHADYPEQWPSLLHWIKCNVRLQDKQVFGALYVLRILSRKYEFQSDEERAPVYLIVDETVPHLLNIFNKLIQITNPSIETADLIKLICKIFWSSIYLEIPKQLFEPNYLMVGWFSS